MANTPVQKAVSTVRAGGLLAYPTEAVIGLGCDPFNQAAVKQLLELKGRSIDKGLILIASDWSQLEDLLRPVNNKQLEQMQSSWPGATTWLVPCKANVPEWLKGRFSSLAVRVPGHSVAREICAELGHPLVSTSANFSGKDASATRAGLADKLVAEIDCIYPEDAGGASAPSQIIDLLTGAVLRPS